MTAKITWALILHAGLALGCLSTLGAPLMQVFWWTDVLTQFRFYWIPALLILSVLLFVGRWRFSALVSACAMAFSLWTVIIYSFGGEPAADDHGSAIRLITYNTRGSYADAAEVEKFLRRKNPDVLLIIEAQRGWASEISKLSDEYEHQLVEFRPGAQGIWLLSRFPILSHDADLLGPEEFHPSISALLDTPSGPLRVLGIHPSVPLSSEGARNRNSQFRHHSAIAGASKAPVVLMGDFNCTPFSKNFSDVLEDGGLKNAAVGFGLRNTWMRGVSMLPIDHVLVSEGIGVSHFEVGPYMGSDHRPLLADVVLGGSG